ncbi:MULTISPECIES: hypothetical protein [unclassified Paenibacillus]|uniref:hypothetical protein n=1 Tax=unclassified Paenibacillus TaxID=185978 RepID=UPI000956CE73|nr:MULTISPECIES: hypothetical protein [unclassified Paenibacillus]ASS65141.1 hypothetical protein CIC07_02680 [Paenibacillus sp. RUD330]SIQ46777.1 hypothetical protein SAMN05880555_1830 [Paenibacillus sp. RU4X]SIQ68680.1 hypothetical protein SAMN05880570_1828 [Paenibacillus sp. RU4T]
MNFADMLGYADIAQLSRIADVYQCECNGHSKNELIQSILSKVGSREVFEAQVGSMRLEDLRFINSLLFDKRELFSLEELIARVQSSKLQDDEASVGGRIAETKRPLADSVPKNRRKGKAQSVPESGPREIISRFKQQGWLFNGISGPERYLFQIPKDLKVKFRDTLRRRFRESLIYAGEPSVYRDEQELLGEDVHALLSYVRHHEVPLTRDGYMHRRTVMQIMESFGVQEEPPAKAAFRFGYGRRFREYPERFSLVYDYCFYNKWIVEEEDVLVLSERGAEALLDRRAAAAEQLYRFWLRLYKGAVPNLLSLAHWIDDLADRWVTADSLRAVLLPFIKPYYYDTADAVMDKRILMMLLHLGMLRIGEDEKLGTVVKMTKLGSAVVAGVHVEHQDVLHVEAGGGAVL